MLVGIKLREIAIIAIIIAADQISKTAIVNNLHELPVAVTAFFDLVFTQNKGVSFGLLASDSMLSRWGLIALTIAITLYLAYLIKREPLTSRRIAFAVVIGGAIGNLIDRFVYGSVVDFLYFNYEQYTFPAFNVADAAITCGAIWLVISSFKKTENAT